MKRLTLVLATIGVLTGVASAQKRDLPPVIAVHMTPQEMARLGDIQKRVADAQAALQKAQGEEGNAKYEIMKAHRTKEIGPDPMCASPMTLTGVAYSVADYGTTQGEGYSSRIDGEWVIFSHDIPYCRGA